jgi:hypothetical protein
MLNFPKRCAKFLINIMPHRTEAVPIRDLPGTLPLVKISDDVDHAAIATSSIKHLNSLSTEILTPDAMWRDCLAMTGTFRTFFGSQRVASAWKELFKRHRPSGLSLIPKTSHITHFGPDVCWIHALYTFETEGYPALTCSGIIGIIPDENNR